MNNNILHLAALLLLNTGCVTHLYVPINTQHNAGSLTFITTYTVSGKTMLAKIVALDYFACYALSQYRVFYICTAYLGQLLACLKYLQSTTTLTQIQWISSLHYLK